MTGAPSHAPDAPETGSAPAPGGSSGFLARLSKALHETSAGTRPDHEDPRLRGRTYPVPFEQVWRATLDLAGGELRGWRVTETDDRRGVIRAEATTLVLRAVDDVEIRMLLDDDGQTRVDARSASRKGRADLGTNARRLAGFFRTLDRRLGRG